MVKTIFTVDDSRTMRDMLKVTLEGAGFAVVPAQDGVIALELLAGQSADVIIVDINMPHMDGFAFVDAVRKTNQATPILLLTTEVSPEKKNRAREAGASGWIIKPFNPDALVAAVRMVAGSS